MRGSHVSDLLHKSVNKRISPDPYSFETWSGFNECTVKQLHVRRTHNHDDGLTGTSVTPWCEESVKLRDYSRAGKTIVGREVFCSVRRCTFRSLPLYWYCVFVLICMLGTCSTVYEGGKWYNTSCTDFLIVVNSIAQPGEVTCIPYHRRMSHGE